MGRGGGGGGGGGGNLNSVELEDHPKHLNVKKCFNLFSESSVLLWKWVAILFLFLSLSLSLSIWFYFYLTDRNAPFLIIHLDEFDLIRWFIQLGRIGSCRLVAGSRASHSSHCVRHSIVAMHRPWWSNRQFVIGWCGRFSQSRSDLVLRRAPH